MRNGRCAEKIAQRLGKKPAECDFEGLAHLSPKAKPLNKERNNESS